MEVNAYYPFGMIIPNLSTWLTYPNEENYYKYNGKELQKDLNLNWLDYGARMYDPGVARWQAPDPMAEKNYHISPYAYCAGNPIYFLDIEGKWMQSTHRYILRKALGGMDISREQYEQLFKASRIIDKGEYQTPYYSPWHSMLDGTTGQTIEDARKKREDMIMERTENFDTNDNDTFYNLGFALHAIADEDSPTHQWKPWYGVEKNKPGTWIHGVEHLSGEFTFFGLFRKKDTQKSIDKVRNFYEDLIRNNIQNNDPFEDESNERGMTWGEVEMWMNRALMQNPNIQIFYR